MAATRRARGVRVASASQAAMNRTMISAYRDVVREIDLTKKSGSVQSTPADWGAKMVSDDISRVGWRRSRESQRHEEQVGAEPARWNPSDRVAGPLGDFPERSDARRVGT